VERVGYARLIDRYSLPARSLAAASVISSAIKGRQVRDLGTEVLHQFQSTYRPDDSSRRTYDSPSMNLAGTKFASMWPTT
jgi:hypothetical protein